MLVRTMLSYTAIWSSPKPASVFMDGRHFGTGCVIGGGLGAGLLVAVPPEVAKHRGWLTARQGNRAAPYDLPSLVPRSCTSQV